MTDRFATTLDCADITFLADGTLAGLPLPSPPGATRTGGIDLNKPCIRVALSAALALAAVPHGFTAPAALSQTVILNPENQALRRGSGSHNRGPG